MPLILKAFDPDVYLYKRNCIEWSIDLILPWSCFLNSEDWWFSGNNWDLLGINWIALDEILPCHTFFKNSQKVWQKKLLFPTKIGSVGDFHTKNMMNNYTVYLVLSSMRIILSKDLFRMTNSTFPQFFIGNAAKWALIKVKSWFKGIGFRLSLNIFAWK